MKNDNLCTLFKLFRIMFYLPIESLLKSLPGMMSNTDLFEKGTATLNGLDSLSDRKSNTQKLRIFMMISSFICLLFFQSE